jgi:hypothetical protein
MAQRGVADLQETAGVAQGQPTGLAGGVQINQVKPTASKTNGLKPVKIYKNLTIDSTCVSQPSIGGRYRQPDVAVELPGGFNQGASRVHLYGG